MNTSNEEEEAYQTVEKVLANSKTLAPKLASIPSLVSLRNVIKEPPLEDEPPSSLLNPNHGHHVLFRALEDLEKLESEITLEQTTLSKITSTVTQDTDDESQSQKDPLQALQAIGMSIPRRVCQHPFKKNDIVWVCRTCQADETCVLCHECFSQSNHDGHDVAFYHAQAGGCCDCGDPDAWDPAGFCPHHGPNATGAFGRNCGLEEHVLERVRGIVPAAVDWLVNTIAANAVKAHARAKPVKNDSSSSQSEAESSSANNSEDDDAMAVDLEHTFVPEAASTSKSIHGSADTSMTASEPDTPSVTQRLGADGLEGRGLFLILHADDIHTSTQIIQALRDLYGGSSYFTDSLLSRLVRALRHHGQLVVWGTMEVVGVCSNTHVHCWLDGDVVASARIGSVLLEKAAKLSKHGLVCSIATRQELQFEQRAVAVLNWLAELARSCDPLCQTVAESILPDCHLVPMLRSDFKVSANITKAWHSLLLTLLAVPTFKSHLAAAYCDIYHYLTLEYASGMGVLERSAYTLSVQFLNRVTYVVDLVQGRDLLGKLGKALLETFSVARIAANNRLDPNHYVLAHRRYSPCISDLKCVLNVKGMARLFASGGGTFLQDWVDSLSLAQFMDGVVWRPMSMGHVEVESRGWVGAFNASISLGSLFERLLSWDDDDKSPIDPSQSVLAQNLLSCVELNFNLLTQGLGTWQSNEMTSYQTKFELTPVTPEYTLCPASLPFSTVASKNGTHLAFDALPVAQEMEWSFHLPLHRFVAASLREACRRPIGQSGGMEELMQRLMTQVPEEQLDSLFRGLMEFPMLVLTRAAQIRAGLWRRNGSMMHDQVINYAEPPFCRSLRDADILLLQFASLGRRPRGQQDVGCALMVNLLLHRFGIFNFLGFAKAPNDNIAQYKQEVERKLYNAETQSRLSVGFLDQHEIALPWTYTAASDLAASLALLEEFLHLLIVLITELPSLPAKDNDDHTLQAKQRLRREVVHRLASGPKPHSELAEVHHVLSHWDNFFLSEEGKLINPDDASGAALGQALAQVAERKTSREKLAPHYWELTRQAWDDYDPSFFHIRMRDHQSAAENRPKPQSVSSAFGVEAKPFAPPKQIPTHPSFQRLERDITADATVLAVAYRTLHVHCTNHSGEAGRDVSQLRGSLAYHSEAMSETALSRVVHLLTLGAFAWKDASVDDSEWKQHGGGSSGSVFHSYGETPAPTAKDWVALALMSPPEDLMDSTWYEGEENTLLMLRRLAAEGGKPGGFVSQDRALRSGAAWLCEFAANHNTDASALIGSTEASTAKDGPDSGASELERRKQAAKQKAMERMKAQAAKFAKQMKKSEEAENEGMDESETEAPGTPQFGAMSPPRELLSRSSTLGSESAHSTSTTATRSPQRSDLGIPQFFSMYSSGGDVHLDDSENGVPDRLLKERPQCIICVDDGSMVTDEAETMTRGSDEEGKRKRSRRKTGSNALAFVGYAQASTVQKGGGGPPPAIDDHSSLSSARRFAGTHVALCGHVMHSECCESYLASVRHREDRSVGRRDEFRCPMCQRLSNCLVPFIDVGLDWTGIQDRAETQTSGVKNNGELSAAAKPSGDGDQSMELDDQEQPHQDLQTFLSTTPWWAGRNDQSVVWDGQCAFISPDASEEKEGDEDAESMDIDDSSPQSQHRRRVRSLRKKDLYAAWTAMMRTPRFVRRRLRPRSSPPSGEATTDTSNVSQTIWPTPPEETSGETVVWRRLMDLISEVAFKADGKRLGERYLHHYCGEFRHYIVEKSAYNIANREGGRSNVEWPACISTAGTLPDSRRQELSREKLLAKLLMSVQAFTYSSCCESHEAKRVLMKEGSSEVAGLALEQCVDAIYSKYGIAGVSCNGKLVLMPAPSVSGSDSDGTQPFRGRLGKLRHFGLAVMVACGAVSADLVQLVMCFPLGKNVANNASDDPLTAYFDSPARAPIVFPLLLGHVLTHVVAAMCAACGRARARSDCLELAWPAPFSRRGNFSGPLREKESLSVSVANDCEGFIKLGVLARILQILLNRMDISASAESGKREMIVLSAIRTMIERDEKESAEFAWMQSCFFLLEHALSPATEMKTADDSSFAEEPRAVLEEQFYDACSVAASEAVSFLADVGVIFQMLVPGAFASFQVESPSKASGKTDLLATLETLRKLLECIGLGTIKEMLQSTLVQEIVRNWYETARSHARVSVAEDSGLYSGKIRSRLYQTEGFRCFDWPMDSIRPYVKSNEPRDDKGATSMIVDTNPASVATERKEIQPASNPASNPLVAFSSKKSIQLLGGYAVTGMEDSLTRAHPRVDTLATSYTDLYATLGSLCPDCDQTALCLVCGEVLNAGGKGECTKHSYRCGGGSCIFFLLQECVGLILHGDLAAYVHSPYVDSHGETPQYRGRPLNLDLDRYNLLHEMWSGHTIRQKVVSERGSARQVIIADFY